MIHSIGITSLVNLINLIKGTEGKISRKNPLVKKKVGQYLPYSFAVSYMAQMFSGDTSDWMLCTAQRT